MSKKTAILITTLLFSIILLYHFVTTENAPNPTLSQSKNVKRIPFPPPPDSIHRPKVKFADFAGSESFASCHQTIFAKFDGQQRRFKDATFTPFTNARNEYMFRLELDGLPQEEYRVDAVVGGGHLVGGGTQTFFSKFPDGTYRFLPFDFIRDEQVWFGETDGGRGWIPITPDLSVSELSEWPPSRILGAHMSLDNCQQCHGSQIITQYDINRQQYETNFTGLDINCESCHGPGKKHIELMKQPNNQELIDIGMTSLSTLSTDESLKVCFSCHALKDILKTEYLPGDDLEEYFSLKLPMLGENPYHPDGRIRAFGYQQNHLHSDCYVNGSMTCVSCHNPHSQSYRDINGQTLSDRFDDRQCTSCHESKALQPELHSFHKPNSPGNNCVACHMPYLQHQAMGEELRFSRSDHTIAIPRPAFDAALGLVNACSQCHEDKSVDFLQAKTEEWYGVFKPHNDKVDRINEFQNNMDRVTAANLLLNDTTHHQMAHMTGLTQFLSTYLRPDMKQLEPEIIDQIKKFVDSPDIDIKATAMASLHLTSDANNEIHNFLGEELKDLDDAIEVKVRSRWATVLPYLAKNYELRGNSQEAILTYKKALEIQPSNVTARINLGIAYETVQDFPNAIKHYTAALKIDQDNENGWINLGNAFQKSGDQNKALVSYREVLKINPRNAVANFNIGNYYYRLGEKNSATGYYEKAIEADPALTQGHFQLARLYIDGRQLNKAIYALRKGLRLEPSNQPANEMLQLLEDQAQP